MKFPKGKPIYEETPSELINLKELVAWIRSNKFNGILRGVASEYETQILIAEGEFRKAFTYHQEKLQLSDKDSIDMFITDALARNLRVYLYSLDSKIIKTLLVSLFTSPKISEKELYLFVPSKILEDCLKKDTISHFSILFPKDKYHFLFEDGDFLGYYIEGEGILKSDPEYKTFYELFNRGEGLLKFYQITEEDFKSLKLPSLKFGIIEEEIDRLINVLLSYINFIHESYLQHGLLNSNLEDHIKKISPFRESLAFFNNKFILKERLTGSWNEVIEYFVSLAKIINSVLAKQWGNKVVLQKYQQVYKNFCEKYKNAPEILEVLEDFSPEKLSF